MKLVIPLILSCACAVNSACKPPVDSKGRPITHGTYRLRTFPSGAKVWVDGELKVEATPATLILVAGTHDLRIQLQGAEPLQKTIEIVAGEAKDVTITIPKPPDATLTVLSDIVGATVRVNGWVRGKTPLQKAVTLPGPLDITVVTPDGRARSIRGELKLSEQKVIEVFFQKPVSEDEDDDGPDEPPMSVPPRQGWLTLGLNPAGEVSTVEGKLLGTTPLTRIQLPAGDHTLVLRSGQLQRIVTVTIEPDQLAVFRFQLLDSDKVR